MKQLYFFLLILCLHFSHAQGQSTSDYNRRGDGFMEKKEYYSARSLYTEGLASCDLYSISQLTEIWKTQPKMQRTMRSIISRCLECLLQLSEEKDPTAMLQLAKYYNEGIGIETDSIQGTYWLNETGKLLGTIAIAETNGSGEAKPKGDSTHTANNPPPGLTEGDTTENNIPRVSTPTDNYHFFIAYTFSPTMPIGITAGIYRKFGLYFSAKSNLIFSNYNYDCNNEIITNYSSSEYYALLNKNTKWSNLSVTVGILAPVISKKLFISAGLGYGQRNYLCQMEEFRYSDDYTKDPPVRTDWCFNTQSSYRGLATELGGMFRYKNLLFSGGVYSISMKDLDFYVGLGYSF